MALLVTNSIAKLLVQAASTRRKAMRYDQPNDPNAGRLVESLRHLGYGNYEAIADIVDNSIDADAQNINIRVQLKSNQHQISVADDGRGMSKKTLDQAMRLGSLTDRDANSDLGKFGMGLVTASLSIAKKLHVISRGEDGCWSSAWDVDEIVLQNAFLKHLDKATPEEEELFASEVRNSATGTLVILTKCDNLTNKNTTSFAANLRGHIGRVHRYFIDAGKILTVNEEQVSPVDPLELTDPATEVVMDDVIPVTVSEEGEKKTDNVRARIVLIPEAPVTDTGIGKSLKSQGFYILRNQREVENAVTLDFFTKHNDFNRMRGELFFPGTLDGLVGIEFTKQKVEFEQSLQDQLGNVLIPICRTIKRKEATKKRVQTSEAQLKLHAQSMKVISEKDKLLIKPKAVIERRASPKQEGEDKHAAPEEPTRERKNFNRSQLVESRLNCVIREERLGPNGQIYECDMEGRKLVIRYNVEHPFYQRFVTDNMDEARSVTATDFLIYSMASAELKTVDSGDLDAVNNFKAVLSSNLRTLLN
ncbi:MAG TPA: ATP-binding protein [Acidobacteriaceae bacterium]|nr:ATP-binding protein [Acidobacteriaceae bacterium]